MNKLTSEDRELIRETVYEILMRVFPNVIASISDKEKEIRAEKIKAHHEDIVNSMFLPSERSPEQNECYAGVGAIRFYVGFAPLGIYTVIGADNKHHAMNKATKLWRQGWTHINTAIWADKVVPAWSCETVKEYGRLVKEYQQLRKGL